MAVPGRRRARGAVAQRVDDLSSRRDALDVEQEQRRIREDAALQRWAGLTVQRDEIESARDVELERLDVERAQIRDEAARRIVDAEADQATVLLELNCDGRTVDQLSTLFGLSLKQVRDMLRVARSAQKSASGRPEPVRIESTRATGAAGPDTTTPPALPGGPAPRGETDRSHGIVRPPPDLPTGADPVARASGGDGLDTPGPA